MLNLAPEKTRESKTLLSILLTLTAGTLAIVLVGIAAGKPRFIGLAGISLGVFFFMFIGYRRGYLRLSAFVTSLYLIGIAAYSIVTGDGIHDVAMIVFPVFLLIGSLLLERRLFFFLASLAVAIVALTGIAEMRGTLTNDLAFATDLPDLALSVILLTCTAVVIHILTVGLVHALSGMQKSEEGYRTIFNATSEAILLHDAETGRILDVNDTMLEMFGYTRSEVDGLTISDLSRGTSPYAKRDAENRLLEASGEGRQLFSWRSKKKDGTLFWTEVALRRTAIDGEARILAVVRDVDEKKRMEAELRQSEKMQVIGQLAGGIAHDFNNQLGGIIGFAELLSSALEDPSLCNYCNNIISSAESAAELNKKLLGFARKGQSEKRPLDINETVRETVSVLTHSVDKRIEVVCRLHEGGLLVRADASQLQNALLNLGINARDAMPKGGTIELSTRPVYLDEAFVSQYPKRAPGEYVMVSVTDTGTGISREVQERMYDPFFTTKAAGKGTGMGLSGVYATVQDHGGLIICYSELDQGTVFKLYLPAEPAGEPRVQPEAEAITRFAGEETILIVDDETTILEIGEKILSDLGYTVRTFSSPLAAIVYYKTHFREIDLVVLDMVMPRSDGLETFKKLKAANPDIRAVVCSGFSERQKVDEILALGVSSFITKPFRKRDLARGVYQALHE